MSSRMKLDLNREEKKKLWIGFERELKNGRHAYGATGKSNDAFIGRKWLLRRRRTAQRQGGRHWRQGIGGFSSS